MKIFSDELIKGSCRREGVVKFTNGPFNFTVQPLLLVKYKEKPTFISVELYNTGMGPENTAIADSIVKSITF